MEYEFKNGKYIINKDGVYFSLTPDQCLEMAELLAEIINKLQEC